MYLSMAMNDEMASVSEDLRIPQNITMNIRPSSTKVKPLQGSLDS